MIIIHPTEKTTLRTGCGEGDGSGWCFGSGWCDGSGCGFGQGSGSGWGDGSGSGWATVNLAYGEKLIEAEAMLPNARPVGQILNRTNKSNAT